jgi:hypothetical protein
MRVAAIMVTTSVLMTSAFAEGFRLAPYKDDLFEYQRVLGELAGGDFIVVEFDDARDVGGRDEIRLKKAYDKFVSLDVNEHMKPMLIHGDEASVQFMGVGKVDGNATIVVIYLHGRHGDRTLAQEDLRFGGNFNRVKNLMLRNGGAYVTPDFSDFGKVGTIEIKTLMQHYAMNSPDAPIIVACASTGCQIVYQLLADPQAADLIDGVVMHGSLPLRSRDRRAFFDLPVFRNPAKHVPIYIGHGSADETVPWVSQELFFNNVKEVAPDYPIRFELFKSDDAVHGTPIRMMDWRLVVNWILAENEAQG